MMQGLHLIQDFSVSVNRPNLSLLNMGVMGLWISGMLLFTFTMVRGWLTIRRIKNYSSPFSNQEVLVLFEECKKRLRIKINGDRYFKKSPISNDIRTFSNIYRHTCSA